MWLYRNIIAQTKLRTETSFVEKDIQASYKLITIKSNFKAQSFSVGILN